MLEDISLDPDNKMKKYSILNGDQTAVDYHVIEFEDEASLIMFKLKYGHLLI